MTDIDAAAIGCSLDAADAERRVGVWRRLLSSAKRYECSDGTCSDGTFHAVFGLSPGLITKVVELCGTEIACCPFFTFDIQITASAVVVTINGPDDALAIITAVLGPVDAWCAPQPIGTRAGDDAGTVQRAARAAGYIPVPAPAAPRRNPRPRSEAQVATR